MTKHVEAMLAMQEKAQLHLIMEITFAKLLSMKV